MNIYTSETEYLKTEVQRLRALVRAQQITIDKLEAQLEQPAQQEITNIERHERNVQKFLAEQPAQQEPVAWRETHSKVIKALAAIVTVHTPDKLFDLDAIPRDPVMGLVQQIRVAIDRYKPPQRKPLTDEEIYSITGVENRDEMMHRMARNIARAIEAAHGIKGQA